MHWFGNFIVGAPAVILKGIKPQWILEAISEEKELARMGIAGNRLDDPKTQALIESGYEGLNPGVLDGSKRLLNSLALVMDHVAD